MLIDFGEPIRAREQGVGLLLVVPSSRLHQPLHAVSLFSANRVPEGDRGGNEIPLRRGGDLHALWDGLLGRGDSLRELNVEVAQLTGRYRDVWDYAAKETDPRKWADESRAMSESFVYSDAILNAVRNAPMGAELAPIELPTEYMREAGGHARQRIIAAGLWLSELLKDTPAAVVAQPSRTPTSPQTLLS